jgi:hypothetical protein
VAGLGRSTEVVYNAGSGVDGSGLAGGRGGEWGRFEQKIPKKPQKTPSINASLYRTASPTLPLPLATTLIQTPTLSLFLHLSFIPHLSFILYPLSFIL